MLLNSFVFRATCVCLLFAFTAIADSAYGGEAVSSRNDLPTELSSANVTDLSHTPLSFVPNRGQWDSRASYRCDIGGATIWYTSHAVLFELTRLTPTEVISSVQLDPMVNNRLAHGDRGRRESLVYALRLNDINQHSVIDGESPTGGTVNYFTGNNPALWQTDIPVFTSIVYRDVYPGIDLRYKGNPNRLEYDFELSPYADPTKISLQFEGVKEISIGDRGELLVTTDWGTLVEQPPKVFQRDNGVNREIKSGYTLGSGSSFGFKLSKEYDPSLPMLIDPVLSFSTYIGGAADDIGAGIITDTAGAIYVTGYTNSGNFPTVGAYDATANGDYDVFVTKLNPNGQSVVYSTFVGGIGDDRASAIAAFPSGEVAITGYTSSSDYPTQNPYDNSANGLQDAFVTRLSAAGNSLVYSTYIGGAGDDRAHGIAVDASGRVYIAGETASSDFPSPSGFDNSANGGFDCFAARLSSSGATLEYGTYLGGSSDDGAFGIAVDNAGVAYLAGYTSSSSFPTASPYDGTHNFGYDAFVSKISASGGTLSYSTFLGGTGADWATGIARDGSNNMYITGLTTSNLFPTANAYDGSFASVFDAFVTKIAASGASLSYSTFLGSSGADQGLAIAVDLSNQAVVTGLTNSSNFPTLNAVRPLWSGLEDMFVTKFTAAGNQLVYSTYLGGSEDEEGLAVAIDKLGNACVAGFTLSAGFPLSLAYDSTHNGSQDIVVARISDANNQPHIALSPSTLSFDAGVNEANPASKTFVLSNGQSNSSTLKWYAVDNQPWMTLSHDSGQTDLKTITVTINTTALTPGVYNGLITITSPNADNSPQSIAVSYEVWNPIVPVVLVHGMASDSLVWNTMKASLTSDGFSYVWRVALDSCGAASENSYASSPRWLFEGNAAKMAATVNNKYNALPANIRQRIRKYDFVAHGMGGLVTRRYLSTTGLDSWTAVPARNVVMLGTPNDGLGLLGDKIKLYRCAGPASSEQHIRRMLLFNSFYPEVSGVDYFAIEGESGCSTTGSILPGCGGWRKLTSRFLDCANDATIPASSAVGQGNGYIDRFAQSYGVTACYATLPTDNTVYTGYIRPILQGSPPASDGDVSPVQPQIGYQFDSSLSAGATKTGTFTVESNNSMTIMLMASNANVKFSLQSPSSVVYDSTSTLPDSTVLFVTDSLGIRGLNIFGAEAGTWQWTVDASSAASPVNFSLIEAIDNSAKVNRWQNLIYPLSSDTLRLMVTAKVGATRITGLTVTATPIYNDSTFGASFNLLDNGASGDSSNADGVYGKLITTLDSGLVRYNVTVTGPSPIGTIKRYLSMAAYVSGSACLCGNVDGSFDGGIDISDLSRLIDYLYISMTPLGCSYAANVDGSIDGNVDIGDLTNLISFLFLSGPPPSCP
jgi:pimeloyl-ACP methyl ester carboxylesterase